MYAYNCFGNSICAEKSQIFANMNRMVDTVCVVNLEQEYLDVHLEKLLTQHLMFYR